VSTAESPVCLLYHGIPDRTDDSCDAAVLEKHIAYLKKNFDLIPFPGPAKAAARNRKPAIALSFDDGFRNNAEVVAPILRRYAAPATFFVCTRHARAGQYLWFSHLQALEKHFRGNGFHFHGEFIDMSSAKRTESMARLRRHLLALRPHPAAMYKEMRDGLPPVEDFAEPRDVRQHYAGLTEEQVGELSRDPLFSVGAHTEDHPFLSHCDRDEATTQLARNKAWIERITGKACDVVAYPSGDYAEETIHLSRNAGFKYGFALSSKRVGAPAFEIPRIGVYSPSLNRLAVKARFGRWIRILRIPIG
jgi:peptidoglycan/xylan/chitin deacetylase (PgdA/CDA1 family)